MRVLQINTVYKNCGSTGRIAYDIKQVMEDDGIESYVAFGFGYEPKPEEVNTVYRIEKDRELFISKLWTKAIGHHGFNNKKETRILLAWIDKIKPDVIHMHNIHNHYVNVRMLLEYIAERQIPCVLTMHDCWTFTGHCAYFDYSGCERWKTGCHNCPNLKAYPKTFALIDPSSWNYEHKRKLFEPLNITFVSPSQWLCELQKQSFLKDKPCKVINNGVDTTIFKPIKSDVRIQYGIGNRKMIFAVAAGLSKRKGSDYLLQLPTLLNDDEVLVIVGLSKKQIRLLPNTKKIIGIQRTKTADELVGLYSEADVFINPTLEDNFPTTNIEALACGTPVVTFNTGGSIECVLDDEIIVSNSGDIIKTKVGAVVPQKDINALLNVAREICLEGKSKYQEKCREKAVKRYNKVMQYKEYIELYKNIYSRNDI